MSAQIETAFGALMRREVLGQPPGSDDDDHELSGGL
jgi:hypothetical protein